MQIAVFEVGFFLALVPSAKLLLFGLSVNRSGSLSMDKGEGQLLEAAALLVGDRVDN